MPKLKAVEVEMSDGSKVMVHEPTFDDLGLFLSCLPALMNVTKIMSSMTESASGAMTAAPVIDPAVLDVLHPLMAKMSGMTEDEIRHLGMWDGVALMWATVSFMPKNLPTQLTASPDSIG